MKAELEGEALAIAPFVQTLLPTTAEGASAALNPSPKQGPAGSFGAAFLVVVDRGNPERTRAKPSMCKNTPINASGHFGPEKLKFLKPKESQVSTTTGRGFHGQHS